LAFREALSRPGLTSGIGTDRQCRLSVSMSAVESRPAVRLVPRRRRSKK
jgi:hypothetical protein